MLRVKKMNRPLVLDFDASLQTFDDADIVPLTDWQEAVRFGCGMANWRKSLVLSGVSP